MGFVKTQITKQFEVDDEGDVKEVMAVNFKYALRPGDDGNHPRHSARRRVGGYMGVPPPDPRPSASRAEAHPILKGHGVWTL